MLDGRAAAIRRERESKMAAAAAVEAAEGNLQQALLFPNPVAEAELEELPFSGGGLSDAEVTLRVSQPIPDSGARRAGCAAG